MQTAAPAPARAAHFRHIGRDRTAEFVANGYKQRWVFAHRAYYLPKCGPDGFKIATRMLGKCQLTACWEVVLFADASELEGFPRDLFFDRDLVWHRQHFGRAGQIASANLVLRDGRVHSMVHLSDVVQRISRARAQKTRIENRFEGWVAMLVNAVLQFARERGARTVAFATADLAIRHTDPARHPQRELFERTYDRRLRDLLDVRRDDDWWIANVAANAHRIVAGEPGIEPVADDRHVVCVSHDIERGLGHVQADPGRARLAEAGAAAALDRMLSIERDAGVRATYNVVGCILSEVRDRIEADDHAIGFHSFDHREEPRRALVPWRRQAIAGGQLERCRGVDYRIRGYRPPQSRRTRELTEERLCFHNFEWLATSAKKLRRLRQPALDRRIVKIPIALDDYPLYEGRMSYAKWERALLGEIDRQPFVAVGLHDCYSDFWLDHYPRLLESLRRHASLRTFDEVADDVIVTSAAPPAAL